MSNASNVSKETYCRGKRDLVGSKSDLLLFKIPEVRMSTLTIEPPFAFARTATWWFSTCFLF